MEASSTLPLPISHLQWWAVLLLVSGHLWFLVFVSFTLTFFSLLDDCFSTKGSHFLDSEDSRQKVNC